MKTFLRENKLGLFLLGVPVFCLIVLWNVNIYRIWYDRTPWKNFGSPSETQIAKIGQLDFPDTSDVPSSASFPRYDSNNLVSGPRPQVYVYGAGDGEIFVLHSLGGWNSVGAVRNPRLDSEIITIQKQCAVDLRNKWGLKEEFVPDARLVEARGFCVPDNHQYVVYQVDENGDVLEKYIQSNDPELLRIQITYLIILFMIGICAIWSAPVWWKRLVEYDPLKLKPDYDAK